MKQRLQWIEHFRVLNAFCVVLAHSCDPYFANSASATESFSGILLESFTRQTVPAFVMISAFLLLPARDPLLPFWSKRVLPLYKKTLFWCLVTGLLYPLYLARFPSSNPALPAEMPLRDAFWAPLTFSYGSIPHWHSFMLMGLLLIFPVLTPWLRAAQQHDLRALIAVSAASTLIPYFKLLCPLFGFKGFSNDRGILGVCVWNEFGTLYYLSGFILYVLVAYYLKAHPVRVSKKVIVFVLLPVFVLCSLVSAFGIKFLQTHGDNFGVEFEWMWSFHSPHVFVQTVISFVIFQNLDTVLGESRLISFLSSVSYAIFAIHFIFVQISYDLLYTPLLVLHPMLAIVIVASVAFIATAITAKALQCVPFVKSLLM